MRNILMQQSRANHSRMYLSLVLSFALLFLLSSTLVGANLVPVPGALASTEATRSFFSHLRKRHLTILDNKLSNALVTHGIVRHVLQVLVNNDLLAASNSNISGNLISSLTHRGAAETHRINLFIV